MLGTLLFAEEGLAVAAAQAGAQLAGMASASAPAGVAASPALGNPAILGAALGDAKLENLAPPEDLFTPPDFD